MDRGVWRAPIHRVTRVRHDRIHLALAHMMIAKWWFSNSVLSSTFTSTLLWECTLSFSLSRWTHWFLVYWVGHNLLVFLCILLKLSHMWPVVVVQSLRHIWLSVALWTAAHQASLSFTISQSLVKLMSIESRWCHSTIVSTVIPFSSRLQSGPTSGSFSISWLFASGIQSIGASASLSNEYLELISFRNDWIALFAF